MAEELPVEAIMEIISWLPIKPILRFKCASKKWFRLLTTDPHLPRLHLHRLIQSNPDPGIMIPRDIGILAYYYVQDYNAGNDSVRFHVPFRSDPMSTYLYAICDGLLCLGLGTSNINSSSVCVWNPLTGDYVTIECPPLPPPYSDYEFPAPLFGFGCHPGSKSEYKVIRIVKCTSDFQSQVCVYTLGTDSWRVLPYLAYAAEAGNRPTVLVNGALHLFADRPPVGTFDPHAVTYSVILSFDLKDEIFREIPQPEGVVYNWSYPSCIVVGELGGLLSVINVSHESGLRVWVMQEYGVVDSWMERLVIIPSGDPNLIDNLFPIGAVKNGEIIMEKNCGQRLALYNPETKTIRDLDNYEDMLSGVYTFRGSIVSPRVIDGKDIIDIEEYGRRYGKFTRNVVKEILSWLPFKPLLRFTCVCKRWQELITSDLFFPVLHLHRLIQSKPSPSILILRSLEKLFFYYAEDYKSCDDAKLVQMRFDSSHSLEIFGICHGLLCLGNSSPDSSTLYLWNPLTGDHDPIYCPPIPSHFSDHEYTTAVYGFGYHQDANAYKLIRILNSYSEDYLSPIFRKAHVNVYTVGTWIWRTLSDTPYNISPSNTSNALVNGAIHWLAARTGVKPLSWNIIVSFDLKSKVFLEIPQPEGVSYNFNDPNKITGGELDGLLSMFCDLDKEFLHVWVMKEYGVVESWKKQFILGPPEIPRSAFRMQIIGAANCEETIIQKNSMELFVYNHKNSSASDLYSTESGMYKVYTFGGSLISPKIINGLGNGNISDTEENGSDSEDASSQPEI